MFDMLHFKHACFSVVMLVLVFVTTYVALEITVRFLDLPDPGLMRDIRTEANNPQTHFSSDVPVYGWNHSSDLRLFPHADIGGKIKARRVLFMGDSVTQGFG